MCIRDRMGDGDDRLAARQHGDGLLDEVLVLRVDARGGLVENDDGRVFENGAGDGDAVSYTHLCSRSCGCRIQTSLP